MKRAFALIACSFLVASCNVVPGDGGGAASSSSALSAAASSSPIVQVMNIQANQEVESPLTVIGIARGTWYFEASFPVRVLDADGNQLAIEPAQAQGDWMTTDYVPFSVTLTFAPTTPTGSLVLEKDNPSGLPENAASVTIPLRFAQ